MKTAAFLMPAAIAAALLLGTAGAQARGGGGYAGGGHTPGGYGYGYRGYGYGGYGAGASIRFGSSRGVYGRIGLNGNRRAYYPDGGFGAPAYYPGGAAYPAATSYETPATTTSNVNIRSVIIRRGPAFGEPGYISHPVVYRLVPSESRRPGTRRFKVERLDF